MEQAAPTVEIWDRRERLTLVRDGERSQQGTPSVLTLRRLTRSVKQALYAGVPANVSNPRASAEIYLGLLVRAAIVWSEGLTDAQTGESVPFATAVDTRVGVTLCSEAVYDALSDLDIAMIIGVADSLLPPSKVREIAEVKLREARSMIEAVENVQSAIKAADQAAAETLKGN